MSLRTCNIIWRKNNRIGIELRHIQLWNSDTYWMYEYFCQYHWYQFGTNKLLQQHSKFLSFTFISHDNSVKWIKCLPKNKITKTKYKNEKIIKSSCCVYSWFRSHRVIVILSKCYRSHRSKIHFIQTHIRTNAHIRHDFFLTTHISREHNFQ